MEGDIFIMSLDDDELKEQLLEKLYPTETHPKDFKLMRILFWKKLVQLTKKQTTLVPLPLPPSAPPPSSSANGKGKEKDASLPANIPLKGTVPFSSPAPVDKPPSLPLPLPPSSESPDSPHNHNNVPTAPTTAADDEQVSIPPQNNSPPPPDKLSTTTQPQQIPKQEEEEEENDSKSTGKVTCDIWFVVFFSPPILRIRKYRIHHLNTPNSPKHTQDKHKHTRK